MDAAALRSSYDQDGFVVVPQVLERNQHMALRAFLTERFQRPPHLRAPHDDEFFLFDLYSREPELRWLLFHPPALAALRALLGGDVVVLRENLAQREQFGHWHKDTTNQERAGHRFHYEPDFRMLSIVYYLQDDTADRGGGLEVDPGSHRELTDRYTRHPRPGPAEPGPTSPASAARVPSRAGDMVVFDFRLTHRASRGATPRPPGPDKIGLFQTFSTASPHVDRYQDFIARRPAYRYLSEFAWPPELRKQARQEGLRLG